MKTCRYCGEKNFDSNTICSRCNQPIYEKHNPFQNQQPIASSYAQTNNGCLVESGLSIATKVIMVSLSVSLGIGFIIFLILWLIALALSPLEATLILPYMLCFFIFGGINVYMTISYFNKIYHKEAISIGFKICAILFVGIVPGVLMLCDSGNGYRYEAIKPTPIPTTIEQPQSNDSINELKRYKELLDIGIITQEEFDAKKKQILGL